MKKILLLSLFVVCVTGALFSSTENIQLSLFNPVQLHPESTDIRGFRLNIYGKNNSLTGVDLGFFNQLGNGKSLGVQWGLVNMVSGSFTGVQFSEGINYTIDMEGVQFGPANYTENMHGIQFGLVNYAKSITGAQLGILNIISDNGFLPVCIIFNFGNL